MKCNAGIVTKYKETKSTNIMIVMNIRIILKVDSVSFCGCQSPCTVVPLYRVYYVCTGCVLRTSFCHGHHSVCLVCLNCVSSGT